MKNFVCSKYLGIRIKWSGCQNIEIGYNDFSAWSVGYICLTNTKWNITIAIWCIFQNEVKKILFMQLHFQQWYFLSFFLPSFNYGLIMCSKKKILAVESRESFRPEWTKVFQKKVSTKELSLTKEDPIIRILSAWDRSHDSTAKRNLSNDMKRTLF